MKFIRDTFLTFSTQIISMILVMAATIIIARILGPSGKGEYTIIILIPSLLGIFGSLGINISNLYFTGIRKYKLSAIVSNSIVLASSIGILCALGFLVYFFFLNPSFLKNIDPTSIVIVACVIPTTILFSYLSHIILGDQKIHYYNLTYLVQSGSLLIFSSIFLFTGWGIIGATLGWSLSTLASTLACLIIIRKMTPLAIAFDVFLFKDSIKFGIYTYLGNMIALLGYRLNILIVNLFIGPISVGYLSISVAMAEMLWYFPGTIGTLLLARTPRMLTKDSNEMTPLICRNTVFLTIMATICLSILGRPIINILFGELYLPALVPMWFLLPGTVAMSINKILCNELIGRGLPIVGTIAAGILLATNIPLNIILIPKMGISGAALSSTISYIISAIVPLIAFKRVSQIGYYDLLVPKSSDILIYSKLPRDIRSKIHWSSVEEFIANL